MKEKGIVVALLLIVALFAMVMPAEAKTYYWFYDHWAVRYEHNEIASSLQPYVDKVEYDLAYSKGHDYGVRLYFTSYGKNCVRYVCPGVIESMVSAVMSAPEWYNERSTASVRSEIYQHGVWPGKMVVYIQYHYQDLEWWEVPYKNL